MLDAWLDHMDVPEAPEGHDPTTYRLGWMDGAYRARAPQAADESELLEQVVVHLAAACGVAPPEEDGPLQQLGVLLEVVRGRSSGEPAPAPAAAPRDAWHPASDVPPTDAEVELQTAAGVLRGIVSQERDPNGIQRLAVVYDDDRALFWSPSTVQRWRFSPPA